MQNTVLLAFYLKHKDSLGEEKEKKKKKAFWKVKSIWLWDSFQREMKMSSPDISKAELSNPKTVHRQEC